MVWIGKCFHGDDEIEVFRELSEILAEWINIYKKDKRPVLKYGC